MAVPLVNSQGLLYQVRGGTGFQTRRFLLMIRKVNLVLFVLMTVAGFGLTTSLFYPFHVNWDAGNVIDNILQGHPVYDNWMGWLYPGLVGGLIQLTHEPHAIGFLQWILYWTAVSTLFAQLFSADRKYFSLFYLAFAFFPGALFYVDYIANSALLYCLYLVMCSISVWMVKKPTRWKLTMLVLLTAVCVCLRADAIFVVLPTLVLVLYRCYGRLWRMTGIVVAGFLVLKTIETAIVAQVPGYNDRINSIQLIALYDQMHISREKQELVIPDSILADGVTRKQMLDSIMTYRELENDYTFYASNVEMLRSRNNWHSGVTPDPKIYLENLSYYLRHRLNILRKYWLGAPELYNAIGDFEYKPQPYQGRVYHYLGWILYFGMPAIGYLLFGLIALLVSLQSRPARRLAVTMLAIWTLWLMLLMVSVTSVSSRYIYPACLCMYQMMIYMIYCTTEHRQKLIKKE